eukprot:SAG31_NODE_1316_length_8838_cov_11.005031_6_plen_66_part_00
MQIRVRKQYGSDRHVCLGWKHNGKGGVRKHARHGKKGVNRVLVLNTVFTNFCLCGVITSDMMVVS